MSDAGRKDATHDAHDASSLSSTSTPTSSSTSSSSSSSTFSGSADGSLSQLFPAHSATTAPSDTDAEDFESERQPETTPETSESPKSPKTRPTLDQARAFLRDPAVVDQPPARKAAFLATKGLPGRDIDALLAGPGSTVSAHPHPTHADPAPTLPPIITYPEFVANATPPPPPPLVTPGAVAGALYGTAAAASLVYAAARLVLAPMADALTDARYELHETASANLAALNTRLAGIVTVVPPLATALGTGNDAEAEIEAEIDLDDASSASSYDDPTEVFHRDIGVQTSLPPSPVAAPRVTMDSTVPNLVSGLAGASSSSSVAVTPSPTQVQADRITALAESVRSLGEDWSGSADLHKDIKTTVETFRADVEKLQRAPAYTYAGGHAGGLYGGTGSGSSTKYPGYVTHTRNEPDDEIRQAKENIRRVKGALLSTRTFPMAR